MATKILFNENKIIVSGHADSAAECKVITAMCDSMANNENFKTIIYESGLAVFEQVSGGESELFAMQDYVLTSKYNQEVGANYDVNKGTIKQRLDDLEALVALIGALPEDTEATTIVGYVDEKTNVPKYQLPYTASELVEKLNKI